MAGRGHGRRVIQGGVQVGDLGFQLSERGRVRGGGARLQSLGQPGRPCQVPAGQVGGLAGVGQPGGRVGADRLQQPVPARARGILELHHRRVNQPG